MKVVHFPDRQKSRGRRGLVVLISLALVGLGGCHRTEIGRAVGFQDPAAPAADRDLAERSQSRGGEILEEQRLRPPPSVRAAPP